MAAITPVGVRFVTVGFTAFTAKMKAAGLSVVTFGKAGTLAGKGLLVLSAAMKVVIVAAAAVAVAIAVATAALASFIVSSVKTSVEVEQSFAKIAKTVQGLAEPGQGISQLGEQVKQEFRDLAKETPIDINELMNIGAIGGQLKIPADQLAQFSDVIAKISVSTNLTSETAATDFAKLASIFGVESENMVNWIERTASSTVFLGNTFATEEASILSFAERIAGIGNSLGFTSAEILGIGAAFSQSGVEMQRGGTAVQKVLIKMQQAANEGGDKLIEFARVAGIEGPEAVKRFAETIKNDAPEAFRQFTEGLGDAGAEAISILTELELTDARLLGAFLNQAGATGELTRAMEGGTQAWEDNIALAREAAIFYETTGSQAKVLDNRLTDLKITVGDIFKESVLKPFQGALANLFDELDVKLGPAFQRLSDAVTEDLLPALGRLAEAFGADLSASGIADFIVGFIDNVSKAATKVGEFADKIAEIKSTIESIGSEGFEATFEDIIPEEGGEGVREFLKSFDRLKETLGGIVDFILETVGKLLEGINIENALLGLGAIFTVLSDTIAGVWTFLEPILTSFVDGFINVATKLGEFDLTGAVEALDDAIGDMGGALKEGTVELGEFLDELFGIDFTGMWADIGTQVGIIFSEVVRIISEKWEGAKEATQEFVDGVLDAFVFVWEDIKSGWEEMTINIKEQIASLVTFFTEKWESLKEIASNILQSIATFIPEKLEAIRLAIEEGMNAIAEFVSSIWETIKEKIATTWDNVKTTVVEKLEAARQAITDTLSRWVQAGKDIIGGIVKGLKNSASDVMDFIVGLLNDIWSEIAEFFDFGSPSRLMEGAGEDIVGGLAKGIDDNALNAVNAAAGLGQATASSVTNNSQVGGAVTTNSRSTVLHANYLETQSPESITDDLVMLEAMGVL